MKIFVILLIFVGSAMLALTVSFVNPALAEQELPSISTPASIHPDDLRQSPLKQQQNGIPLDEIQCKESLTLVIKSSNNSPACVKPLTAKKLIQCGWIINEDSESLNKKWGELYLEYQLLKESFSDYLNNMTTIERMAEIDDETMRIATILSEREFTIDIPEINIRNVTFGDPVYPVPDGEIDSEPEFEVQREIAKQIYKFLPKNDDSTYLGMRLGDDRKSIQFGMDITKLTPEKNKEYYEKLFEEKFSGVIPYKVVFKKRQGGDE